MTNTRGTLRSNTRTNVLSYGPLDPVTSIGNAFASSISTALDTTPIAKPGFDLYNQFLPEDQKISIWEYNKLLEVEKASNNKKYLLIPAYILLLIVVFMIGYMFVGMDRVVPE